MRRDIAPKWLRVSFICVLAYYMFIKIFIVMLFAIPGPWRPVLVGTNTLGEEFAYRSRRVGHESDDILIVKHDSGEVQEYIINNTHALNVWHARIAYNEKERGVWVESGQRVICSLHLPTREFRNEAMLQFNWAQCNQGVTLSEGLCVLWWEIFLPW